MAIDVIFSAQNPEFPGSNFPPHANEPAYRNLAQGSTVEINGTPYTIDFASSYYKLSHQNTGEVAIECTASDLALANS